MSMLDKIDKLEICEFEFVRRGNLLFKRGSWTPQLEVEFLG